MSAELVRVLTGYACDLHPRVSEGEMERAITETENFFGCDADDFNDDMEGHAIARAVDLRITHEQDWFDGSEG